MSTFVDACLGFLVKIVNQMIYASLIHAKTMLHALSQVMEISNVNVLLVSLA